MRDATGRRRAGEQVLPFVEGGHETDANGGLAVAILSRCLAGAASAGTCVKKHNYVSFAATGNKFRRFAREIAGDLRYCRTIIHWPAGRPTGRRCVAATLPFPRTRSTSSRGYAPLSEDVASAKSTTSGPAAAVAVASLLGKR